MGGYTSSHHYRVTREGGGEVITFRLERVAFEQPYVRRWSLDEGPGLQHYLDLLDQGLSLGAYDSDLLVGLCIGEAREWNRTLWLWEFGVDADYHQQGIARRLIEGMTELGREAGMRCLLAETQSTNDNAIQFYLSAGFEIDALDLSYYSNHDAPDGEVALFMKRKLE